MSVGVEGRAGRVSGRRIEVQDSFRGESRGGGTTAFHPTLSPSVSSPVSFNQDMGVRLCAYRHSR